MKIPINAAAIMLFGSSVTFVSSAPMPDNPKWPGHPHHVDSLDGNEPHLYNAVFSNVNVADREEPGSRPPAPPPGTVTVADGDASKPASSD